MRPFPYPGKLPKWRNGFQQGLFALAVAFVCAAFSSTASAQVIVIQSTADGLKTGTTIGNDQTITIRAGKQAVFVLPSGSTRTVSGPFDGKAADLTKGVKANPSLLAAVKQYVKTGGSNQRAVGAVRSVAPVALARPLPFSWHAVPASADGDYCIEKGAKVSLVRAQASRAQTVTIINLQTKRRSQTAFEANQTSIPWPDDMNLDAGATYAILLQGRPMRRLRLRMIAPIPSREDTLQVLHGQRCQSQFRAYIAQLQSAR